MELPDDYFTEEDEIARQLADDDAYWANYRRQWEETEAMTVFVLEDVDAGANQVGIVVLHQVGARSDNDLVIIRLADWLAVTKQEPSP